MKKILTLLLSCSLLGACITLKEINQTIDCQYDLIGVEVTEYSLNNLSADVALAITNKSKDTNARMTRFSGKVYLNDAPISDVNLGEFLIEPQQTQVQKVTVNVPFSQVGKNVLGLVLANSNTIKYKVVGTAYFASPFGDIPFPIVFTRSDK